MPKPTSDIREVVARTFPVDLDTAALAQIAGTLADDLCATMRAIHGGKWSAHIDHETGFALVRAHGELGGDHGS